MKLGTLGRAAVLASVSLVSVVAAAQTGGTQPGLNIPDTVQFVGRQTPNVRKATAIVNGEIITGTDVDHRVALIIASNNVQLPPDELERVRAQVLRNIIDEALQIQAAAQQDIKIERSDIDNYYARFAQSFNQTPETFSTYLRSIGSSERSLKRQIEGELAWRRLLNRQIEPFVNVSAEEVQAVLERLEASRGTSEYRVGEIFISATPETAAEARNNAMQIVQQLRGGASFAAYARQFSEASTAAVGGDLGWVRAGQLPDELAVAVTQMPIGSVSEPIQVPGGFSIVGLLDSRQILTADPRDAVLSLLQMSVAFPAGTTTQQAEPKIRQLAERSQSMGGCGRAADTAREIGAELVSNDQVRVRELPGPLQQTLLGLSIGQATQPFGSAERVSVLILCGREDPQPANEPSAEDIHERLSEERVNRRAQRYLRDLRRDAVIEYR